MAAVDSSAVAIPSLMLPLRISYHRHHGHAGTIRQVATHHAREQFTAVSNLVLGLSTGLIAFESSVLNTLRRGEHSWLVAVPLILLGGSIALGLWCAWN